MHGSKHRVSIICDGWKDARNHPLINAVAISRKGAMFSRVVDCEGQVKDSPFISNILCRFIEEIGLRNVVQVVIDNDKNYRVARLLV